MSHSVYRWHDRIRDVEREYDAVRSSIGEMRDAVARGAGSLNGVKVRDLNMADRNLEGTYLIRLWAEFETAVRSYYGWMTSDPDTRIGTHDLINTVAGVRRGRRIVADVQQAVHGVREYRNMLVHARDNPAPPVSLSDARRSLNIYLCKLPDVWG